MRSGDERNDLTPIDNGSSQQHGEQDFPESQNDTTGSPGGKETNNQEDQDEDAEDETLQGTEEGDETVQGDEEGAEEDGDKDKDKEGEVDDHVPAATDTGMGDDLEGLVKDIRV
jgi:hypothetical protein